MAPHCLFKITCLKEKHYNQTDDLNMSKVAIVPACHCSRLLDPGRWTCRVRIDDSSAHILPHLENLKLTLSLKWNQTRKDYIRKWAQLFPSKYPMLWGPEWILVKDGWDIFSWLMQCLSYQWRGNWNAHLIVEIPSGCEWKFEVFKWMGYGKLERVKFVTVAVGFDNNRSLIEVACLAEFHMNPIKFQMEEFHSLSNTSVVKFSRWQHHYYLTNFHSSSSCSGNFETKRFS